RRARAAQQRQRARVVLRDPDAGAGGGALSPFLVGFFTAKARRTQRGSGGRNLRGWGTRTLGEQFSGLRVLRAFAVKKSRPRNSATPASVHALPLDSVAPSR